MDKGQSSTELSTHPTQSCAVGSSAPLFTLEAIDAERKIVSISLSDFRSRWLVILFYPRDFSFVCPTEIIGFSSEKEQFDLRQCDLLGISIDSLDSHRAWLQTPVDSGGVEGLRFPLASDPTGDVCRAYGLWRPKEELPNRGLAVVDPEGELRYFAVFDLAVGRSVHDVLRMIDALKVGGLCPANWRNADGVLDVGKMLQPGRVLGHYRIERFIGAGGFAQVLSAHDLRLGRRVALKILAPRSDASEGMLLDEARMAARVNHPNVCTIYAVDVIDTVPTIVMEMIDGPPLSKTISDGSCAEHFEAIAIKLAKGLAAAHAEGVVHGDIKPANVLLRSANNPVLVDFGLARPRLQARRRSLGSTNADRERSTMETTLDMPALSPVDQSPRIGEIAVTEEFDSRNTGAGISGVGSSGAGPGSSQLSDFEGIAGTPAYMSPEQARGELLSEASDLFSLGMLFVEILTGEAPLRKFKAIQILGLLQDESFLKSIPNSLTESDRERFADLFALDPSKRPSAKELVNRLT